MFSINKMTLKERLEQGINEMINIEDSRKKEIFYKQFRKEMKSNTSGATQNDYLDKIDGAYERSNNKN